MFQSNINNINGSRMKFVHCPEIFPFIYIEKLELENIFISVCHG